MILLLTSWIMQKKRSIREDALKHHCCIMEMTSKSWLCVHEESATVPAGAGDIRQLKIQYFTWSISDSFCWHKCHMFSFYNLLYKYILFSFPTAVFSFLLLQIFLLVTFASDSLTVITLRHCRCSLVLFKETSRYLKPLAH